MPSAHPPRDWRPIARVAARLFAAAACLIGAVELLAWLAQPDWIPLTSPAYHMKATAALAVTLIGAAMLLHDGPGAGVRLALARALASGALAVTLATVVAHATGWSIGFDRWLGARDPTGDVGRMALQSAVTLSLFAVAVLTHTARRGLGAAVANGSLIAGGIVLELMATGYFDGATLLYDLTGLSKAAPQSAVAQMLAGGAVVFGRAASGAFPLFTGAGAGGSALRVLMPIVVVVPVVLGRVRLGGEEQGWFTAPYGHTLFAVAQTVILGLAVYALARSINRIEARYQAERQRRREFERYVAVCAWTRRIRWEGRWISVEEFLERRFNLQVSHGISDDALAEQLAALGDLTSDSASEPDPPAPPGATESTRPPVPPESRADGPNSLRTISGRPPAPGTTRSSSSGRR
jgi:hypothetical protein